MMCSGTSLLPSGGVVGCTHHCVTGRCDRDLLLHIVRALFGSGRTMLTVSSGDFTANEAGKYTLPQKLMHLAWSVAILVAIVTGLLLLQKAGVPFLARDPYTRPMATWGFLTLLHDLAALLSVFLILVHVYFGLLPEKRAYCAPW